MVLGRREAAAHDRRDGHIVPIAVDDLKAELADAFVF